MCKTSESKLCPCYFQVKHFKSWKQAPKKRELDALQFDVIRCAEYAEASQEQKKFLQDMFLLIGMALPWPFRMIIVNAPVKTNQCLNARGTIYSFDRFTWSVRVVPATCSSYYKRPQGSGIPIHGFRLTWMASSV